VSFVAARQADETTSSGGNGGEAAAGENVSTLTVLDRVTISSDSAAEHHQSVTAPVDFGTESVAHATLHVELESPCFPFDRWTADQIPEGHNFPLYCDAFDRTFEISLDNPEPGSEGEPGLELARAITPFGGPLALDFDVTDIVNGLPGEHALRVLIPTYADPDGLVSGAKGEWIVSATLSREFGKAPRNVLAVEPLLYGSFTQAAPPAVVFDAPDGTVAARLDYLTTGHGSGSAFGCRGPAEEFCQRTHTLSLDGAIVAEFDPWRSDCHTLCTLTHYESDVVSADYCAENPTGAPESVRAPRANWCPGSVTPPFVVENETLTSPGAHEFAWSANAIAEGGSFLVSAVYYAFGE
jgi:hypothetical protein